jgi:hypothetical protein
MNFRKTVGTLARCAEAGAKMAMRCQTHMLSGRQTFYPCIVPVMSGNMENLEKLLKLR